MTTNNTNKVTRVLPVGLLITALYAASTYSYLLFHTLVEVFTVIVMSSVFVLAWNTRHWMENRYFLFIGIAFLFVSLIDLLHALAYKGMNIFQGYDANLPTQLWILARYIQSISLLVAPVWLKKRLPVRTTIFGYLVLTSACLWLVFSGRFPASEYIVILILVAGMIPLLANRDRFDPGVLRSLLSFLAVTIATELAFTAYLNVYDSAALIGHLLRLISYFLLYNALIRTGLQQPFDLVFRDLKRKEKDLLRTEADLQRLFDISPFPIFITRQSDSSFIKVNQAALELYEVRQEDLANYRGIEFYADPTERSNLLRKVREDGIVQNEPLELKKVSGKHIWCLVNMTPLVFNEEPCLLVGMADISEQKRIQEELRYLSTHDALTSVYNRTYFEAEVKRLQNGRRFPVSAIMFDMDDLKRVNDTYGHAAGDKLLQKVAILVKEILRAEEVFARIGGDEFAILLPNAEINTARQVTQRIKSQLEKHARENGKERISISIGMGVADEREDLNEALKRADADMYTNKNIKKGNTNPLKS
jgi:diguanylate cyclase (GGDEF)-like protein/PAS domain S-box-containing protein